MADNTDSTATGGLMVILGIIVAIAAIYFFFGMKDHNSTPDVSISVPHVEAPDVKVPDVHVDND